MAELASTFQAWSTTAGSNGPLGTDTPSTLDNSIRTAAAVMRALLGTLDTIASAATCDIGSKAAGQLTVSGTTTITSFGTSLTSTGYGMVYVLTFSGVLTLTHSASLVCITGANITTEAGDTCVVRYSSSGWTMLWYCRRSGASLGIGGQMANGSAASPALAFVNSATTGIYRVGADDIGIATAGTLRFDVSTTKVTSTLPIVVPDGSSSLPAISKNINGSNDPGMYFSGNNVILQGDGNAATLTVTTSAVNVASTASGGTPLSVSHQSVSTNPDPLVNLNFYADAGTTFNAVEITADSNGTPNLIWRVRGDGATFADGAYSGSGADYAEAFLPLGEPPAQRQSVVLVGDRIRAATDADDPLDIIGVVSERACAIGDAGLLEQGGVPVGLVGKLRVAPGAPVNPSWRLLAGDLYLVR